MRHITTSADLRRVLERMAEAFAHGLVDAVSGASFDDLTELAGLNELGVPSGRTPARRGRPASETQQPKPASRAPSGASVPGARGDVLASIVAHLRAQSDGIRAEEIRRELGLDKATFVRAIQDGLATEEIRKAGRLRATVYFAE